jgi:hypothetical protein
MVYSNVWNALDAFGGGDSDTVGDIFETFYPYQNNFTVGNTFIQWNPNDVYNATFLDSFTAQQLSVVIFDVFGKIFESYGLRLPDEYSQLFEQLADGEVPNNDETFVELVVMLLTRFVVSAVYYLVACV